MKKYFKLLLIILTVIGFVIRIWRIGESPPSLNWDEAALGYNAYSLLRTGRDEFGMKLPVSLRSFDDYKPAAYAYFTVVWAGIFGSGELSTRFSSVIAGSGMIFLVGVLALRLTGSRLVGLAAAFVQCTSPWAIHFSRIAFESNLAMFLCYLVIGLVTNKNKSLVSRGAAMVVAILAMYTYHSTRVIALPILVATVIFFDSYKQWFSWKLITLLVLLIPLGINFLTSPIGARFENTNFLRLSPFTPQGFEWFYKLGYGFLWQFFGQILAYFSPANLFIRGSGEPIQRLWETGLLNVELAIFWVAGIVGIFRLKKKFWWLLIVTGLFILPGAVTWNWYSVVRTLGLLPVHGFLIALGFDKFVKKSYLAGILLVVGALYGMLTVIIFNPVRNYGDFQPGFEKTAPFVVSKINDYDKIIIESPHIAPYIFFLFYGQYPPLKYHNETGFGRQNVGTEDLVFGKFEFRKIKDEDFLRKKTLLVGPVNVIADWRVQELQIQDLANFYDTLGYISFRVIGI